MYGMVDAFANICVSRFCVGSFKMMLINLLSQFSCCTYCCAFHVYRMVFVSSAQGFSAYKARFDNYNPNNKRALMFKLILINYMCMGVNFKVVSLSKC